MSCPAPTPPYCPQVCPPPPSPPPCRVKPLMRRLLMNQIKFSITTVVTLCTVTGICVYTFLGTPRRAYYKEYYARGEFEDWADEMARKGLFQAVTADSLKDNQHMNKK